MSDRNASLINAIENVYPQAHHGYCVWHLSQNMKINASNINRDVVAWRFMECSRKYTVAEFDSAYESFKTRYPYAAKYLEESTVKEKWATTCFPGDRYNLDTSNAVESLDNMFTDARKYSLIPMIDIIVKKIYDWFNDHRKETVTGSTDNKLVPFLENYLHDSWHVAEKLNVSELISYELEYDVIGSDGKSYLVKLILRSCSCRMFDIEKYPCVHAIAAFIAFKNNAARNREIGGHDIQLELHELCTRYYWTELWAMAYWRTIYLVSDMSEWIVPDHREIGGHDIQLELHELCTRYYWTELWAMAYWRTIYLVSDMSEWIVPDHIKELHIIPPDRVKKKGRRKTKRFPSGGERRPRTRNKRRSRQGFQWLLFGFGSPV